MGERWLTVEDIDRDFREAERNKKSSRSSVYSNYSISSWTTDAPTESPRIYRKMNKEEAGLSFSRQQLAPPRKGAHGQKYVSESRDKAQSFVNRGDKTPDDEKVVVRYKLDKEKYSHYRENLEHQAGAKGSKKDLWHREGLSGNKGTKGTAPSNDLINIGVQSQNIDEFNGMVKYKGVKKVRKKRE